MPRQPPRVLLIDDHPGILVALARLLGPSCEVVGQVSDGQAIMERVLTLAPDLVIVDLNMPHMNGLEVCRRITAERPATRVVVLTATIDAAVEERALLLGASAFVVKYRIANDLMPAIERALAAPAPAS